MIFSYTDSTSLLHYNLSTEPAVPADDFWQGRAGPGRGTILVQISLVQYLCLGTRQGTAQSDSREEAPLHHALFGTQQHWREIMWSSGQMFDVKVRMGHAGEVVQIGFFPGWRITVQ